MENIPNDFYILHEVMAFLVRAHHFLTAERNNYNENMHTHVYI